MLASVTACQTVLELNAARRDLFNQVYKRGLTVEEFDHGYENIFQHAQTIGLHYHIDFRTYGPRNIEPIRSLLHQIRYSRFVKQFNQAADYIRQQHDARLLTQAQYEMIWTLLTKQAEFLGYEWNQYQYKFYES